jgi:hypothetical protein
LHELGFAEFLTGGEHCLVEGCSVEHDAMLARKLDEARAGISGLLELALHAVQERRVTRHFLDGGSQGARGKAGAQASPNGFRTVGAALRRL